MSDEPDRQDLEDRVEQLESTISKMLPSRRDALKLGGAALVGGAAMSGSASAGTEQAGTIGTANDPVDVESEDINNADTVTTNKLDATSVDSDEYVGTFEVVDVVNSPPFTVNTTKYNELMVYFNGIDALGGGENVFVIVDGKTAGYESVFVDGSKKDNASGHLVGNNTFGGRRTAGAVMISGGNNFAPITTITGTGSNRGYSASAVSAHTILDNNNNAGSNTPVSVSMVDGSSLSANDMKGGNMVVLGVNHPGN